MKQYNNTTYKISKLITKEYSTSFYTAALLFNSKNRQAIFSIYGFVRFADEIVDSFHSVNQKLLLDKFEKDFKNDLEIGLSLNPVLHAFILVVKKYDINIDLIDAFLQSMRNDLTVYQYETTKKIKKYIYGSAEVVGLMCLKVFCNGNMDKYNELEKNAKSLGAAFQKVNFLRDLNEDVFILNRTYFPQIIENTFNETSKQQIVDDINKDFDNALGGIKKLPNDAKTAVYIAYLYYKKLLNKIHKTPASTILNNRIRIPNIVKLFILLKAMFLSKLKLIK